MAGCSPAGFMLHVFVMAQVNQKNKTKRKLFVLYKRAGPD